MADLILVFLLSALTVFLPVVLLVYVGGRLRSGALRYIPLGVVSQLFFLSLVAAAIYPFIGFGWLKYVTCVLAATLLTGLALHAIDKSGLLDPAEAGPPRFLVVFALIAFIAVLDGFYILASQGFVGDHPAYFRAPFHSDNQRNLILINSLIRGEGSPFLPGAQHAYQMFWYHGAAVLVSLFDAASGYGFVSGYTLFTAYLFYFILFWSLHVLRPDVFQRYWVLIPLVIVFVAHTEIYNMVWSWLQTGQFALEADGSFANRLYRSFSIKGATLTAPQHIAFLTIFVASLASFRLVAANKQRAVLWYKAGCSLMGFMVSPLLWAMSFPCYFIYDITLYLKERGRLIRAMARYTAIMAAAILLAAAAYWIVLRVSPVDIFMRSGSEQTIMFATDSIWQFSKDALKSPVILVRILGVLAVLLMIFALKKIYEGALRTIYNEYLVVLLILFIASNLILYNGEIRRHATLVANLAAISLVTIYVPSLKAAPEEGFTKYLLIASAIISIGVQSFFVLSFTQKPSVISSDIVWSDYYCINKVIATEHGHAPALGAVGEGLRFPVVMEATASFARPEDTYAHSNVSPDKIALLDKLKAGQTSVGLADQLGIRLIVWGPVEDRAWGEQARTQVAESGRLLHACGTVSLYGM